MAAASIQRTLAALAMATCLFGPTSIATAENLFKIPGTNYYISLNAAQPLNTADSQPLLAAIADWISKEFTLPVVDRFPEIKLISPSEIGALRYKSPVPPAPHEVGRDPGLAQPQSSTHPLTNDTVAVYIDGAEIIYLIDGWTGRTPADLSVLVHEMVHHIQFKLGLKHECLQDREKLAYAAQDRWLHLFGHSLESDFELMAFRYTVKRIAFTDCASARAHRNSPKKAA
jgi:hypothetical protein